MSTATPERLQLAHNVSACRALGMTWRETAAELRISYGYARALYDDPDGSQAAARKARYRGTCEACGRPTHGSNGRALAPRLCLRCTTRLQGEARRGTGPLVSKIIELCREKPRRAVDLAAELGTTRNTVNVALHRLRRYGLVRRVGRGLYRTAA